MASDILNKLESQWITLKPELKRPRLNRKSKKILSELLLACVQAGRDVTDPVDRADLQLLAKNVADSIFWTSGEYPNAAILPVAINVDLAKDSLQTRVNNIPSTRNYLFTGREAVLDEIHQTLSKYGMAALSGLGGIGKTHTAVEYAYRHFDEYKHLLWANANNRESLIDGFSEIAATLNIPEKDAQKQVDTIRGVRSWLENNSGWLLILDNADDLNLAREFIVSGADGHTLLTTRAQATGDISRVVLDKMTLAEGALLLLRRAKILAKEPDQDLDKDTYASAIEIVHEMDGLPLAIDQAGAFIEARQLSLPEYLELYRKEGTTLRRLRGEFTSSHPGSVHLTFAIAFKNLEQRNVAAADFIRICAFLEPEAIPEEIFIKGASEFGESLSSQLSDALGFFTILNEAAKFSLIKRHSASRTIDIHRLVQVVIQDEMNVETRHSWAERTVRAVIKSFPSSTPEYWRLCDRFLPHTAAAAVLIDEWQFEFEGVVDLLNHASAYCYQRAKYVEAERFVQQALGIRKRLVDVPPPDVAESLHRLALIYHRVSKYEAAESYYLQSLKIREECLPADHTDLAMSFNNLAWLYYLQGKYAAAEQLYIKSLGIRRKVLGEDHPKIAVSLNNLARLYYTQGRYEEAEPLYMRSLEIRLKHLEQPHPDVAQSFSNLALLYYTQERYSEAESLYKRSLDIYQRALVPDHPEVVQTLNNLGLLYSKQQEYEKAELLLKQAFLISQKKLGTDHPEVAQSLNNLAWLYGKQGKIDDAEMLARRALAVREVALGPAHVYVAISLSTLAEILAENQEYLEAEEMMLRALKIRKAALGENHLDVAESLSGLALLYKKLGKYDEAEGALQEANSIREKILHH